MSMPKVSVIVPVYNTEKYLDKCLQSLIDQTLEEIEIVIINDGSTDQSPAIIQNFVTKYPEKIMYLSKENGGQASARNIGIQQCHGEFIGFLDSDDFVSKEMFEKMYHQAVETQSDYVACGYTDVYEKNGQIKVLKQYVASAPCRQPRDMFFNALVSPFLHLYKSEIVKNSMVTFPEGVIYEDTAFYLNLIPYISKVTYLEESLAFRMRHSNSTMTTISQKRVAQIFEVIDDIQKWYSDKDFNREYQKEKEYFCVRVLLGSSMNRISKVKTGQERQELVQQTFAYLKTNFPEYKKNPYFEKGKKNLLIRSITKHNCGLYVRALRIANKMRNEYL